MFKRYYAVNFIYPLIYSAIFKIYILIYITDLHRVDLLKKCRS